MIQPFAKPEQEFMMIHNSIIDVIMPMCTSNEFLILMAIFRKTRGWDKERDRISYSQLMEMTGIKSPATISKTTSSLQEKGMILIQPGDNEIANCYTLNVGYSLGTSINEAGVLQKIKYPTSKNEDTKDTNKDKDKYKNIINENFEEEFVEGEPTYIDAGDEFNVENNSWKYPDGLKNQDIIQEVFSVCGGRKYFRSPKEYRKWKLIDGQISRGAMKKEWVKSCIEWAASKNQVVCAIKVDAVASLVLNKARMQDWLKENMRNLISPEDFF